MSIHPRSAGEVDPHGLEPGTGREGRLTENVTRHLPDKVAGVVEKRMRAAYRNPDPFAGQRDLEALARELDHAHPGAAASLREGLAKTFTVAPCGSAKPGVHAALDQLRGVDDRDLP